MKVIGIIGSRRRHNSKDFLKVQEAFCQIFETGDMVCSGMCKQGADQFAVLLSDIWECNPIWHWADWNKFNKAAGFIRNAYIARDSKVLIACVSEDRKGGTEDTIEKFKKNHPEGIVYLV
jgi:hypothetical protein